MRMERYWLNTKNLRYRFNNLEYGPARTDAENWLGAEDLGWFGSAELMNDYVRAQIIPALERAWRANPYLRFGQFVSRITETIPSDMFYLDDGQMRLTLESIAHEQS